MDTPVIDAAKKLELRERQLQEALARINIKDATRAHEIASSQLSQYFQSLQVEGFTLAPDTVEYKPVPEPAAPVA
jgi:hypothetical protein